MAILGDDDLKAIKEVIKVTIDEAIEEKLVTKVDISHLPTKDEFYTKMDEVMGELKQSGKNKLYKASTSQIMMTE